MGVVSLSRGLSWLQWTVLVRFNYVHITKKYCKLIYILGIDDFNKVYQECKQCSAKWEEIGLNLGISKSSLDIIQTDYHNCEECMFEMLSKWLKKENAKCIPSWRSLCQAIYSVDRDTADQIAKKHHVGDYTGMQNRYMMKKETWLLSLHI